MNRLFVITLVPLVFALSGCDRIAKIENLRTNPEILTIGTFKGCDVSYVDRGYRQDSFYIATCETAIAVTGNTGDKSNYPVATVQNITGLSKEEHELIMKNRSSARASALSKLTPEEKAILGVK